MCQPAGHLCLLLIVGPAARRQAGAAAAIGGGGGGDRRGSQSRALALCRLPSMHYLPRKSWAGQLQGIARVLGQGSGCRKGHGQQQEARQPINRIHHGTGRLWNNPQGATSSTDRHEGSCRSTQCSWQQGRPIRLVAAAISPSDHRPAAPPLPGERAAADRSLSLAARSSSKRSNA